MQDGNKRRQNIQGMQNPIKKEKSMTFIKSKKCDIVFMQETHLLPVETKRLCQCWVGHAFASCGSNQSRSVVTLISKQLLDKYKVDFAK